MWQGWRSHDGRWVGSNWGLGALLAETLVVLGPQGCVCGSRQSWQDGVIFPPWCQQVGSVEVLVVWYEIRGAWEVCGRGVWSGAGVQVGLWGGEQMVAEQGRSSKRWAARSSPYLCSVLKVPPPLLLWLCLAACRILGPWPGPNSCTPRQWKPRVLTIGRQGSLPPPTFSG